MSSPSSTRTAGIPPSRNRGRVPLRRVRRIVLVVLGALVVLIGSGAIYQVAATAVDQQDHPARGRLVDVGGHRLHLYCTGPTDTGNPTVVLEGGLGATVPAWAWVQAGIARTARVCAYDRAGTGWSDPGTDPPDAHHIAGALHALLHQADVAGPYVLVGWSIGGLYVREYADEFPADVAGVVLLDSSSTEQCTSTPSAAAQCDSTSGLFAVMPALARIGVMRVLGSLQAATGLPEPENSDMRAAASATKDLDTRAAELRAAPATYAQVRDAALPSGVPLSVVTATDHETAPDLERLWTGWQNDMAALSSNRVHRVVAGASHVSLVLDEEDARLSVAAVLEVVAAVRSGQPLGP
ncbi:alpha/beta fold hydrolase [Pseudonocardia sp. CA-107938]|uniref:alpha/beta fold hydrolase n=1 Tax=Pseudonocardia sp. CA-107938 TaxID=3240021 RepID=UPI003D932157